IQVCRGEVQLCTEEREHNIPIQYFIFRNFRTNPILRGDLVLDGNDFSACKNMHDAVMRHKKYTLSACKNKKNISKLRHATS
ncbi:MAG: hypothetical protein ABF436_04150, partial [Acetobacter okinawensis]|uniref:hypothetical protein n=1 Tax=Acetobacter okinawensis TaxID=1076594 RepID=UPI0039ED59DF